MATQKRTLLSLIKAEVEVLPVEAAFLLDLKTTVSTVQEPYKGSNYYKPSSMNCPRLMYYIRTNAPRDLEIREYSNIRICETGSLSHDALQGYICKMQQCGKPWKYVDVEEYIKQTGLTYLTVVGKQGHETKLLDTRYNISFLCDGILLNTATNTYYILEIKTETDNKGNNRKEADESHSQQSYCYSLSLRISNILWLYEERNFCTPKTFLTVVTPEQRHKTIALIEMVDGHVKTLTVPPKPEKLSIKVCAYCNYKQQCKLSK